MQRSETHPMDDVKSTTNRGNATCVHMIMSMAVSTVVCAIIHDLNLRHLNCGAILRDML